MASVTLEQVSKTYSGNVIAVREFSMEIRDGELVVLVGPSGCGKSTTLRMVAGLEEISSGTIRIGGRVVNDVPPKDRDIAMVFQNYALYPHMTVYDNMAFGLKLRHVPRAEIDARVRQAAEVLGLADYLQRRPKALSGGQRQRVAMGRAMVRNPAVFLFDEPLSNLDAKMRVEMRKEVLHLHRRLKTTMIYVTHDQVEAMTLGDRIVVMRDGLIEQAGPPAEVFENPRTVFVARFIGSPPMNLLEGVLRKEGETMVFDGGELLAAFPPTKGSLIAAHAGRKVFLGLRPRAFTLARAVTAAADTWRVNIDVTEMLGEELLVHVAAGPHRFILGIAENQRGALGADALRVCPNLTNAHVYDVESGRSLTFSASGA